MIGVSNSRAFGHIGVYVLRVRCVAVSCEICLPFRPIRSFYGPAPYMISMLLNKQCMWM